MDIRQGSTGSMTDITPPVNTGATILDTVIKDAETAGDAAADTAIDAVAIAAVPLLGLPIINQIFTSVVAWIVSSLSNLLGKGLQLTGTFFIVEFQSQTEMESAKSSLIQLQKDAMAKASSGTITADEAAWLAAVSAFIRSDGSASPQ